MVNFFAIGAKISSRPVHDLVVEKVNGHEHYRLSTELDLKKLPAGSKIVQAIEFDSIPDIKTGFLGKQAIIKIPGQLDLLLESILDYDPETECFKSYYNTQDIKCDSDVVVILRREDLFVQPWEYSLISYKTKCISCFSIERENFDLNSFMLKTRPEFKSFAHGLIALKKIFRSPVRIVINSDSPIPVEIKDTYNFVEYKIKDSEERYLISDPIEDISVKVDDSAFFFKNRISSLLEVKRTAAPVVTYDFSTSYRGWYFIVLPFITFIKGLACVKGKFVSGKLVHLSQSSGYGKTRLCFELLRYEKRGIYCVFRSSPEGYPGTTPWMKSLINAFKETKNDDESLRVCAKFILLSMKIFGTHEIDENKNQTTDLFEGKNKSLDMEFDLKLESKETYDSLISLIKKEDEEFTKESSRKLFSIIFDECHELLAAPTGHQSGLSLSLWLCGLDSFEKSLFFDHEEIIKDLNTILSGQRDFLNAIDYPEVQLPSRLQTSEEGARFLVSCARPLGNRSNLFSEDVSLQKSEKDVEIYKKKLEMLNIPKFAKEYQSSLTFTSKKEFVDQIKDKAQKVSEAESKNYEEGAKKIISEIENDNFQYETKSDLADRKRKYRDDFKAIRESESEEHKKQVELRKAALQSELEQLLDRRSGRQPTVAEPRNQSAGQKRSAPQRPTASENPQPRRISLRLAAKKKSKTTKT